MSGILQYSLDEIGGLGKWAGSRLDDPDPSLLMGLVSLPLQKRTETIENKRYYVSDTEMIERRFLKEATEEFDKDKDSDPFGESTLYKRLYDCAIRNLGIESKIREMEQKKFLSGSLVSGVSFAEIIQMVSTKKIKNLEILASQKLSDDIMVHNLSKAMNVPVIIESNDSFENTFVTWDSDLEIVYLRQVVDGWLGIRGTYQELMDKGVITEPMTKPRLKRKCLGVIMNTPIDPTNNRTFVIRKKVKEILEELKRLNIPTNGAKKKNEIVKVYCDSIVFPERFLSRIKCE